MFNSIRIILPLSLVFVAACSKTPEEPQFPNSPNVRVTNGITPEREAQIQKWVEERFSQMSQEEKILQLMGEADQPRLARGEAISGYNIKGATTLPQQIGISSSWNPELLKTNTEYTSKLMRSLGTTLALSPMLDVSRDARWGRMEESFGEDAYLTSRMGLAFVKGMQGEDLTKGVATTTKHFAGYGYNKKVNNDLRYFIEEVLLPHEVVVRLGNSQSLMPGYHAYGGQPAHASEFLLKDVLRDQWGFDGVVVSDYFAVKQINTSHHYVEDKLHAGATALNTGVDIELPDGDTYKLLPEALEKGLITQQAIDTAVKRVLTLKGRLGLLDPGYEPQIDENIDKDPADYRQRAYLSATQSVVLLKNEDVLPIKQSVKNIALVGPNADAVESLLGDYTYQSLSLYWGKKPIDDSDPELFTLLEGLTAKVADDVTINYERGVDWTKSYADSIAKVNKNIGDEREKQVVEIQSKDFGIPNPERALEFARNSDLIIAAMGENRYLSGESRSRNNIRLAGEQEQFVKKLIATGKPVVLIIFGGRPHALAEVEPGVKAIVQAWYPGEEGGNAVADLLLGNVNPSAKMTVTVPRTSSQAPVYYKGGYEGDKNPLYPFGHGLSYTTYSYGAYSAPASATTTDKWIPVSFELKNSGDMDGAEIAQVYVKAKGLSMPQPAQELVGFARVDLAAGESKKVTVYIAPEQLSFLDKEMDLVIEPGEYEILVGASSTDIKLASKLSLSGEKIVLPQREVFFSETIVE